MKMKIVHAGKEYDIAAQDGISTVQNIEDVAKSFEQVINRCQTFRGELVNGDILIMGKQAVADCVILISKE